MNTPNSSNQDRSDSNVVLSSSPSTSLTVVGALSPSTAVNSVPDLQEKRSDVISRDVVDASDVDIIGEREEGEGQEAGEDSSGRMDASLTVNSRTSHSSRLDSTRTLVDEDGQESSGSRWVFSNRKELIR